MSYTSSTLFSSPLRKAAAEMEKKADSIQRRKHHHPKNRSSAVWDCGSSLYDSFELKAFKEQLDSAIATGRSLSMPRTLVDPPTPASSCSGKKTKKKNTSSRAVPKSINKLLRAVFMVRPAGGEEQSPTSALEADYLSVVDDDWMCGLETIQEETCDKGSGARLNYASVGRRSLSERWFAGRTGLMCR